MNGPTSLIIHNQKALQEGCEIAQEIPGEIQRVKLTTQAIKSGDLLLENAVEAKQLLQGTEAEVYIGGGITDTAIEEGKLAEHISELQRLGINTIEVGNPSEDLIRTLQGEFETVLGEIGSKSRTDKYSSDYSEWEKSLKIAMNGGLQDIIIEGGTGSVGIYTHNDELRNLLLMHLMYETQKFGYEGDTIIEASQPAQQDMVYSILGPETHLANISTQSYKIEAPHDIRSIRKRNSTIYPERIGAFYELIDYLFKVAEEKGISPSKFMFDSRLTDIHGIQVLHSMEIIKDFLDNMIPMDSSQFIGTGSIVISSGSLEGTDLEGLDIGQLLGALVRHLDSED